VERGVRQEPYPSYLQDGGRTAYVTDPQRRRRLFGTRHRMWPRIGPLWARFATGCANICSMHPGVMPPSDDAELGLNTADPATLVIDLNCAFASIEQQHDPGLRGRPLAIAAYATGAATIVSSSREARGLGIKTGMRVFEGKAIFLQLEVMEPNPPRYRAGSDHLI